MTAYEFVSHCLQDMDMPAFMAFEKECAVLRTAWKPKPSYSPQPSGWWENTRYMMAILEDVRHGKRKDEPWMRQIEGSASYHASRSAKVVGEKERAYQCIIDELEQRLGTQ